MYKRLFLIASIIISTIHCSAQNDSIVADSIEVKKAVKKGDFFVGVDVFTPALSFFTDRKEFQAMAQYRVHNQWYAVVEMGYGSNHFDENSWTADVDGVFGKVGFNYFISEDPKNLSNGFYTGFRFAYANYNQEYSKIPVRDLSSGEVVSTYALPQTTVNAYWMEIVVGARMSLVKNLYVDFSIHPAFYLGGKEDNGLESKIIPGFGKHNTIMNFPVFWGLTYKLF